jgi:hypothetical protein
LQAGSDVEEAVLADPSQLEPYKLTAKATMVIARAMELWRRHDQALRSAAPNDPAGPNVS